MKLSTNRIREACITIGDVYNRNGDVNNLNPHRSEVITELCIGLNPAKPFYDDEPAAWRSFVETLYKETQQALLEKDFSQKEADYLTLPVLNYMLCKWCNKGIMNSCTNFISTHTVRMIESGTARGKGYPEGYNIDSQTLPSGYFYDYWAAIRLTQDPYIWEYTKEEHLPKITNAQIQIAIKENPELIQKAGKATLKAAGIGTTA